MMYYMVDFCIHSPVPSSFSLYRVQTGHPFLLSCIGFLFCIWYHRFLRQFVPLKLHRAHLHYNLTHILWIFINNSDNRLCLVASTLDLCLLLFTMCNVLFLVLFKVSNYTLWLMLGFSAVANYLEALLCASDDGVYPRYDNVVGHPGPLSIAASPREETSRWVRR